MTNDEITAAIVKINDALGYLISNRRTYEKELKENAHEIDLLLKKKDILERRMTPIKRVKACTHADVVKRTSSLLPDLDKMSDKQLALLAQVLAGGGA